MKSVRISLSGKWKDNFNNYNFTKMEENQSNKEGVLFYHIIQGEMLPCYCPKYLTENNLWRE